MKIQIEKSEISFYSSTNEWFCIIPTQVIDYLNTTGDSPLTKITPDNWKDLLSLPINNLQLIRIDESKVDKIYALRFKVE